MGYNKSWKKNNADRGSIIMKGKLIVIEGVDGSGKQTQSDELYQRLKKEGHKIMKISFPDYEAESSALVKMYLRGDFGDNPDEISPYVASSFFAVDRYASFQTKWKEFYSQGGILIADRYTTSNMVHQASKIIDPKERDEFLDWLYDLEFKMYKIPIPDLVFFLDVPPEITMEMTKKRLNKFTGEELKDIHEKDVHHMKSSYDNAHHVANKYNWRKISCVKGGTLLSIEEIASKIYREVLKGF